MLWVLKRTVSMRRFIWAPKTYAKIMGINKLTILLKKMCLSKPMLAYSGTVWHTKVLEHNS